VSRGNARRAARRRVSSHSHSLTAVLPRTFLLSMNTRRGDYVVLQLFPGEWRFEIRPLVTASGASYTPPSVDPSRIAVRKLVARGNSLMVAIPRMFLHELHLLERDAITLRLADDNSCIEVTPVTRRQFGPPAPSTPWGTAEVRP